MFADFGWGAVVEGTWARFPFAVQDAFEQWRLSVFFMEALLAAAVLGYAKLWRKKVPGELFSSLQPPGVAVLGYANGYYRYIAPRQAYDDGWYEALAAILAPGEGEKLIGEIEKLLRQLDKE